MAATAATTTGATSALVKKAGASGDGEIEQLRFITPEQAWNVVGAYGSPVYVYDLATLQSRANQFLSVPNPYGLTVRYAAKAWTSKAVLELFNSMGLWFDVASGNEAKRVINAGVDPSHVQMSSQELPSDFGELFTSGVRINLCSLDQIRRFGESPAIVALRASRGAAGVEVGIRINPGIGSGGTNTTNTGGPSASFGVWYALLPDAVALATQYGLVFRTVHMHIGSGSDPTIWIKAVNLTIGFIEQYFPDCTTIDVGGGYKVARMSYENATDIMKCGREVSALLVQFAQKTGRKLYLEMEPGTYLVANAGCTISKIQDIVSTEKDCDAGHVFLKLDTGMTSVLRPMLYGAQHPLVVVPQKVVPDPNTMEYVVVGHDCESGDLLTPAPSNPEELKPRLMQEATIGDLCVIEATGAYCSSMSTAHYNSFTEAPEVMLTGKGPSDFVLIRKAQSLSDLWANELSFH
ncbi:diaminopimelate decarboxylase [Pelomyxa schiedti]|nr:diaminopimelate decarboxylase [Pelomyxa schiedti]